MDFKDKKAISVLSAEDDEDYFSLLECILTSELGVETVLHAANGEELVNRLKKCAENKESSHWPDLILLDLNMPKKSGLEALQEIRNNPKIPKIKIFILSVSKDAHDIEKSYSLGADSFITKPTNIMDLVGILRKVLAH